MARLRSLRQAAVPGLVLLLALLSLGVSACGGSGGAPPVAEPLHEPGSGGTLDWAIADPVRTLDPLAASTYPDDMIAAQVFEPLISDVRGPGSSGGGRMPGLASVTSTRGGRVWRISLRPGVRFHDGAELDADAVVQNFARWEVLQPGRRLLPAIRDVVAVSGLTVRVRLTRPDVQFAETLASPRLGIVSPDAFSADSAATARVTFPDSAGSGPFRLVAPGPISISLISNPTWWATGLDVGPALTGLNFNRITSAEERLVELESGVAQVADGPFSRDLTDDPLLVRRALANGEGQDLGVERSVRGLSTSQYPPQLARVWLTDLGG